MPAEKKKNVISRASKEITVTKSNRLVEAAYHLTLAEQRLLLLVIARLDGRDSIEPGICHIITATQLADAFGIPLKQAYELLQSAAERLYARSVVIYHPDAENPALDRIQTRWVSTIHYLPSEGCIGFFFAPGIIPFISQLKREFSQYRLVHIAQLSSSYAIRLYELLVQWRDRGEREIPLDWLRERLQLEERYANIRDLKRRVIQPAVDQINEYTDLWVKWGQRKTGRQVVAITFSFGEKASRPPVQTISGASKSPRITRAYVERNAKPGESWEQAEARLRRQHDRHQE